MTINNPTLVAGTPGPDPLPSVTRRLRLRPLLEFLGSSSVGGAMLMLSAVAAITLSNSPLAGRYAAALHLPIGISVGNWAFTGDVHLWINDGLMAVFFLLVGLELRRELTTGELASVRRAALPGIAALGGMVVPALIFIALNRGDTLALRGWAVPVATDIAFALAVCSVLGSRMPLGLKVFLTALAIMDDLGAIVVIALFYTVHLDLVALGSAVLLWLALWGLGRAGVRGLGIYLLGGGVLWALVFHSGVHATLAGVALAFALPMHPAPGEAEGPAARLEHALGPWVSFLVLPLFGLANAGLSLGTLPPGTITDTVALGILLGLLVGKPVGVYGATVLATRFGLAQMPAGITRVQLFGASALCGIGFTMSLFIGELAFRGQPRDDEVKIAVFCASILAALLGLAVLRLARRPEA